MYIWGGGVRVGGGGQGGCEWRSGEAFVKIQNKIYFFLGGGGGGSGQGGSGPYLLTYKQLSAVLVCFMLRVNVNLK